MKRELAGFLFYFRQWGYFYCIFRVLGANLNKKMTDYLYFLHF